MLRAIPYYPVCANKEREHEDIDAMLLTKSSGKCPNSRRGLKPATTCLAETLFSSCTYVFALNLSFSLPIKTK